MQIVEATGQCAPQPQGDHRCDGLTVHAMLGAEATPLFSKFSGRKFVTWMFDACFCVEQNACELQPEH